MSGTAERWDLDVGDIRGPIALVDEAGHFVRLAPEAQSLLSHLAPTASGLPPEVWRALEQVDVGASVDWFPSLAERRVVQCSRFRASSGWVVVLREVSGASAALSRQLHRQRLEVTGRLVASIAHELRNAVSSLVYSADLLAVREQLPEVEMDEVALGITHASRRLQATVDGLLDYARLGPTVSVPVSLREVLTRSQGFLRSYYRSRSHTLRVAVRPEAEWVQGNSIIIEQVFVNLLLNAAEAATEPIVVQVTSEAWTSDDDRALVRVRVRDDGPGVPPALRSRLFEPFVTTRPNGTGLGLAYSREAVESLGGAIALEDTDEGASFVVDLPKAAAP
ncbi:MAG: ATP-binding protein [Sandaracinus sp.]